MDHIEYGKKIDTSYFCPAARLPAKELGHVFIILFQRGYLVQASSHVLYTLDILLWIRVISVLMLRQRALYYFNPS